MLRVFKAHRDQVWVWLRMRIVDHVTKKKKSTVWLYVPRLEMSDNDHHVVLKRGMERVEVDTSRVTAEVLRRTFRVRTCLLRPNMRGKHLVLQLPIVL